MNDSQPNAGQAAADDAPLSFPDDLRKLADDARRLAEAEFAYQKSRATFAGKEVRSIASLGLVALVLIYFALMAAILGTVVALAERFGAWQATAIVGGALLAMAVILAIFALLRVRRMKQMLAEDRTPN